VSRKASNLHPAPLPGTAASLGTDSCFGDDVKADAAAFAFLGKLEAVINQRLTDKPEGSYTAKLWSQGPPRMAQKVGEEGVEVALAAVTQSDDKLIGEAADLLFHLSLLLKSRNLSLQSVVGELEKRHREKT
jgi:phosphoribosyl-ATP pyrophosphohydrolase/phosphoribosyl-AMP cyclohydrolase